MSWLKDNKNKITFAYIFCFVCYIALNEVELFSIYAGSVNQYIYSAFAVLGGLLLLADFLFERRMFKAKGTGWLILFVGAILVSTVVNISFGFAENIKTMAWTAISMLLLYPFAYTQKREDAVKQIKALSNALSIFSVITVCISLWMYVTQLNLDQLMSNHRYGFVEGRLYGVFTDPNYAAVMMLCIMAMSVFYIANTKSVLMKVFHSINLFLSYIYVVLSASRTAQLVFTAAMLLFVGLWIYRTLDKKNMKRWLAATCAVLIATTSAVATFASFTPVRYYSGYLPSIMAEKDDPDEPDEPIKPIDTDRPDVGEDKDISNHRFEIWKDAINLWKVSPVVGTSPRNHLKFAEKYFPDSFMVQRQYSTHNGYLSLLTYTGVLGAGVMLVFILLYFYHLLKKLFGAKSDYHTLSVAPLLGLIALVVISAFPMMMIFFLNTIRELIFWLMLGYIIVLTGGEEDTHKPSLLYRLSEKVFAAKK
ncbi:MAG: O-antigen ligase family protein [Clostridia bacterium]|nr:O-antigen ligase family protein [Clostridia bacterium]